MPQLIPLIKKFFSIIVPCIIYVTMSFFLKTSIIPFVLWYIFGDDLPASIIKKRLDLKNYICKMNPNTNTSGHTPRRIGLLPPGLPAGERLGGFAKEKWQAIENEPFHGSQTQGPWILSQLNPNIGNQIQVKIPFAINNLVPIDRSNMDSVELENYTGNSVSRYPSEGRLCLKHPEPSIYDSKQLGHLTAKMAFFHLKGVYYGNLAEPSASDVRLMEALEIMSKENLELGTNETVPKYTVYNKQVHLWCNIYSVEMNGRIIKRFQN